MARCVILSACPVSPALAGLLREDDFIIACDAGYRNCAPLHCKPHVIVGDFDTAPCPQGRPRRELCLTCAYSCVLLRMPNSLRSTPRSSLGLLSTITCIPIPTFPSDTTL